MGACASALKGKKDTAAAPAPEPLKEEVPAADATQTITTPVKQEAEDRKEEVEALKEAAKGDSNSEATKVASSETKAEALPVCEPAAPVTPKTEETSPAEAAVVEEKKTAA